MLDVDLLDFANQGVLYMPKHLLNPVVMGRVLGSYRISELIDAAGGRTLALFHPGAE